MGKRETASASTWSVAALLVLAAIGFACTREPATATETAAQLPYEAMAARMVAALQPEPGERVLLRYDPELMHKLLDETRKQLEAAGAQVSSLPYGEAEDFEQRLSQTDAYIWLPVADQFTSTPPEQAEALGRWLDEGRGRQIHFHWGSGTFGLDGVPGTHSAAYDRVYAEALEIDYQALDQQMEAAIAKLRAGEVRVTTPAGTDVRFRVGERPFTKQNGDASRAAMQSAVVRIQREIELPAGALRVAPLEETVEGTIVIPWARAGAAVVRGIRLQFERGVITRATAEENEAALREFLDSGSALKHFREFALGFNPKLVTPEDERWIAYYGYGAGVVRLSLGNNAELGGAVRGGGVWWFFFPDATVRVGEEVLVEAGQLK
ncbi:MAG: aminopeptidase [Acidobacteria bacterium]|nr:aminopeptidase [Acidobacteriota bacterium]